MDFDDRSSRSQVGPAMVIRSVLSMDGLENDYTNLLACCHQSVLYLVYYSILVLYSYTNQHLVWLTSNDGLQHDEDSHLSQPEKSPGPPRNRASLSCLLFHMFLLVKNGSWTWSTMSMKTQRRMTSCVAKNLESTIHIMEPSFTQQLANDVWLLVPYWPHIGLQKTTIYSGKTRHL